MEAIRAAGTSELEPAAVAAAESGRVYATVDEACARCASHSRTRALCTCLLCLAFAFAFDLTPMHHQPC